ncbi:MAG: DMT family transporter [Proteobacteria bacterium]|nr:DMT family transporter [Pseudomonadota bacterium]MCH9711025.1 DMT family transporter [Pseudomonadota bacterium]MCH9749811.1 DMT family transporter [Pseudomonadota bacterium]
MSTKINTVMGVKEWLMLIILSILWGGSFFFVEVILQDLSALTIVTLRLLLATFVLWGVALYLNLQVPKSAKIWLAFLVMGLLNNAIPFTLIVWGQTQIASSLASILNAAMPFFTVIVAGLWLADERVGTLKIIGICIGFSGVVLMIGLPANSNMTTVIAQMAVLGAGLSYAFASAYGRRFQAMTISPIILAAGQTSTSSLLMLPIAYSVDGAPIMGNWSIETILSIIALAVLSTAVAYVLYFKILSSAGAVNISLVTLLVPISAILLGVVILNETITTIHLLGLSMIALGLSAIDGRLWRSKQDNSSFD